MNTDFDVFLNIKDASMIYGRNNDNLRLFYNLKQLFHLFSRVSSNNSVITFYSVREMQRKHKISIAALAVLVLCILTTNLALGTVPSLDSKEKTNVLAVDIGDEVERLKELIPATIEETKAEICPIRNRFLMWTRNGAHIMWGFYGNGKFVGTDNMRKRCWGIYGKGIFAGFYDGEFFWGRYHNGTWKAQYLFGLRYSDGRYVLFPGMTSVEISP